MNKYKSIMLFIAVFLSGLSVIHAQESATQKMVSLLPDDVLVFIETSGGDALKADFEGTILGRIWNEPSMQSFYQQIEQSIMTKAQEESSMSEASAYVNMAKNIISLVGSRPIIIGAAQKKAEDGPPVYGFAIIDAGSKKDAISRILSNFEAMAGEDGMADVKIGSNTFHGPKHDSGVPGYWGWVGNYFVFAINDGDGLATKHLDGNIKRKLPNYLHSSSIKNDALAVYVNFEKAFNLIKKVARAEGEDEALEVIETVMSQLGLDKLKTTSSRVGFSGSDILSDELVNISQPLTGLFANMKPVGMDTFNVVSPNAVTASALNLDMAGIYDIVMKTMKSVAGEDFEEVEQGIEQMESQMQIKIRDGLLESLNGKMVFYQAPIDLSAMQGGFVVVLGLKNVQLWNETITSLSQMAAEMANNMVQISSQEVNGRTMNTIAILPLAVAQLMPTWTIVGDNVVIASSPTICNAAAEQAASGTKDNSIRNNEKFQKATAKIPSNVLSLSYTDSKVQMTQTMAGLQQLWPIATMFAAQRGIGNLPIVIPDLSNVIKDVTPSVQYTWLDEKGMHSIYKGAGIEPSLGAIAGTAFGVGILMPALARTRQIAFRMVAGTNLSGIGKAMLIYANDYDDEFPPNLEELIEKCDLTEKVFENKRKPAYFDGPTYIYITGQTTSDYPENILVYENPEYCSDGLNVLYLDSHVEFVTKEEFLRDLEETYKRLGRPMPEVKFRGY